MHKQNFSFFDKFSYYTCILYNISVAPAILCSSTDPGHCLLLGTVQGARMVLMIRQMTL